MIIHSERSPLAGTVVHIAEGVIDPAQGLVVPGAEAQIEDYYDRVNGESWMTSVGNFAALHYAIRSAANNLPVDDDVLYCHIGYLGHIIHASEIV